MVIEFKFCNGQRLLNCVLNWKNWITVNLAKKEVKHKHFSHLLRSFNYIFYLPNFPNFRCLFNYFWLFSKCLFSKRWIDHVAKTVALPFNASTNSAKHSTRREFGRQQIRAVLARRKRERARRLGAVFWEANATDVCLSVAFLAAALLRWLCGLLDRRRVDNRLFECNSHSVRSNSSAPQ